MDDGEIVLLQDKGHIINDQLKGDIKITVHVENNSPFIRSGLDLLYRKSITLKESLCGFAFEMSHLNGKTLCMNNMTGKTIIKPKFRKIIPKMGMMREQNIGNLIIEFDVDFPESLTDEQIQVLTETL